MDRATLRVVAAYICFGIFWILASDWLIASLFQDFEAFASGQTIKGALYIFLTALLLYLLLNREARLRRINEDSFSYLFASNPIPMWIYQKDTLRFLLVNTAALERYGYSQEEFLSMTLLDIRPEEDIPAVMEYIAQPRPAYRQAGEWRHVKKNGEVISVEIYSHEMIYKGSRAILTASIDITERKEAEKTRRENILLSAAIENEKQAYERRNRIASMISHDFRTPIGVITASASMLRTYDERLGGEQRQRHHLAILENAKHLNKQLDELLNFLRLDAASAQFNPSSGDLAAIIRETAEQFQNTYSERTWLLDLPESLIAECDLDLMRRVIENLLSNAYKYSSHGSAIYITLRQQDDAIIIVRDTGIGIPDKELPNLFDPYFRGSNTGGRAGYGLGMYIVKQAVELHGGSIAVSSEVGKGTEVQVHLPLKYPDALAVSVIGG